MNIFGQGATGPAGMPLTREMTQGGEQRTFVGQEPFIPAAEPTPVQEPTTATYLSPDESRTRFAEFLPIEATPNDTLLPSDDPRVYTYQTPNGNIYYLPTYQEQLQERRSVREVVDNLIDAVPSRTEVEDALLGAPSAIYDSISRQVHGGATYSDVLNTGLGLAGANLPRTVPDNSLGMFTGNQGTYGQRHLNERAAAEISANSPEEVWQDYRWRLRTQGAPFDYTEVSDQNTRIRDIPFNQIVHQLQDRNISYIQVPLSGVLVDGFDPGIGESLFSIYPELKNVEVRFARQNGNTKGSFNPTTGGITVAIDHSDRYNMSDNVRSTLLHEIQHWVQEREGWQAQGTNPSWLASDDGFWQGISPKLTNSGDYASPEHYAVDTFIDASRQYGTLFWQREFLREYEMEPDRVYRSIVDNVKPEHRNPIEQLVVNDYEHFNNQVTQGPQSNDGWTTYNSSTFTPDSFEATTRRLDMDLYEIREDIQNRANQIGLLPEEVEVFKQLGLVSSSDNFASYMSEHGEIQARNTQFRRDMPSETRYNQFPEDTEYSRQAGWNMFQVQPLRLEAQDIVKRILGEP